MTEQRHEKKAGKCMVSNWLEERAVAFIDTEQTKAKIQRYGHRCILSINEGAKMEDITTMRTFYVPPKGPTVKLQGRRIEHLEKQIAQAARERIELQMKPAPCQQEYCSVAHKDFKVEGFVPFTPQSAEDHDYRSEDAITFWNENYDKIQGVTPVRSMVAPFRKCSQFSRPIGERLDEVDPSLDD